jgi:nicotinamide-nucleotide amidase
MTQNPDDVTDLAAAIADVCESRTLTIGTAESLTGGAIASALSAAPSASDWFVGSVVAYSTRTKQELLGVSEGPVVTERAAREMALGARHLLSADVVVSVTGAGGPEGQDGREPGTVCFALATPGGVIAETRQFDGSPEEVVLSSVRHSLTLLRAAV